MKTICIIEARMRSSRLPGKVLKPILGKPLLERMIERVKRARTIDEIVVATTDAAGDEPLVELASRLGVGSFRGSEDDVLLRVLEASKAYGGDIIVETPGDFPLIDPAMIDKAVADFKIGNIDYVVNEMEYCLLPGSDVRVFTTAGLDEVNRLTQDPADHEHVSIYFHEHRDRYRVRVVSTDLKPSFDKVRLAVDHPEDFQVVNHIFEELYPKNPAFSMGDVYELLNRKPELRAINQHLQPKKIR